MKSFSFCVAHGIAFPIVGAAAAARNVNLKRDIRLDRQKACHGENLRLL